MWNLALLLWQVVPGPTGTPLPLPVGPVAEGELNQWVPVLLGLLAVLGAMIPATVTIVTTMGNVKIKVAEVGVQVNQVQRQVIITDQKIDITSARVDGKLTELMAALEIINIAKGVQQEKDRAAGERLQMDVIAEQTRTGHAQAAMQIQQDETGRQQTDRGVRQGETGRQQDDRGAEQATRGEQQSARDSRQDERDAHAPGAPQPVVVVNEIPVPVKLTDEEYDPPPPTT